jgi:hypothetical protein
MPDAEPELDPADGEPEDGDALLPDEPQAAAIRARATTTTARRVAPHVDRPTP